MKKLISFLIIVITIIIAGSTAMVKASTIGALSCNIQMTQSNYNYGDIVTASILRLANSGTTSIPAEIKIWLEWPGGPPISVKNVGANGSVSIPVGFDKDFGPLTLFSISDSTDLGFYEFSCRILDPVTGLILSEDINKFSVGPVQYPNYGTIQGVVRDSTTLQPIVGAKVAIGVVEATTDATGLYVLRDIPLTVDSINGTANGTYQVTVDLRNVTSPVNMKDPTPIPRYPEFAYRTASIVFTNINDSPTTTNHDSPIFAWVANLQIDIGKLASNIDGVVNGCNGTNYSIPVGGGYTVQLFTAAVSIGNTGSGLLAIIMTDSNGKFAFNNVEANLPVVIVATSPDGTQEGILNVTTPPDFQTVVVELHTCPENN